MCHQNFENLILIVWNKCYSLSISMSKTSNMEFYLTCIETRYYNKRQWRIRGIKWRLQLYKSFSVIYLKFCGFQITFQIQTVPFYTTSIIRKTIINLLTYKKVLRIDLSQCLIANILTICDKFLLPCISNFRLMSSNLLWIDVYRCWYFT